jgi:NADH-quinone oxidoreductase subunit M
MIAHGFVVVGLFFIADILFTEGMKQELSMKWAVFVQAKICFDVLILVLASVALPTTFNSLVNLPYCIV